MSEMSTRPQMAPPEVAPWLNGLYQAIPLALAALLFLNPLPYLFSLKEICFYLPAILFLVSLAFHRPKLLLKTPLTLPLLLFTAWAAIGLSTALDPGDSLHDFRSHWLRYLVLYYLLVNFFGTSQRLEFLGRTLLVSGFLFSIAIWLWWYVVEAQPLTTRLGLTWERLATALNGFTTILAMILAFHYATVAPSKSGRRNFYYLAAITFVVSLMSQSRSTTIGLVIAIVVMLINRRRLLLLAVLVLAFFVVFMPIRHRLFTSLTDENYAVRIGHLLYFAEIVKDYPLTGTGFSLDTLKDRQHFDSKEYLKRLPTQYQNPPHPYYWPHNVLFDVAARTGLVGLGLFVLILGRTFHVAIGLMRRGRNAYIRSWAKCCLAALAMFFTKALFEPVATHYAETILFAILAMITIIWRIDRCLPVDIALMPHCWHRLDARTEANSKIPACIIVQGES